MDLRHLWPCSKRQWKIANQGELFGNTNTLADGFLTLQSLALAGIWLQTYSNNNAEFGKSQVT